MKHLKTIFLTDRDIRYLDGILRSNTPTDSQSDEFFCNVTIRTALAMARVTTPENDA